jgi:hypothetical protein
LKPSVKTARAFLIGHRCAATVLCALSIKYAQRNKLGNSDLCPNYDVLRLRGEMIFGCAVFESDSNHSASILVLVSVHRMLVCIHAVRVGSLRMHKVDHTAAVHVIHT